MLGGTIGEKLRGGGWMEVVVAAVVGAWWRREEEEEWRKNYYPRGMVRELLPPFGGNIISLLPPPLPSQNPNNYHLHHFHPSNILYFSIITSPKSFPSY